MLNQLKNLAFNINSTICNKIKFTAKPVLTFTASQILNWLQLWVHHFPKSGLITSKSTSPFFLFLPLFWAYGNVVEPSYEFQTFCCTYSTGKWNTKLNTNDDSRALQNATMSRFSTLLHLGIRLRIDQYISLKKNPTHFRNQKWTGTLGKESCFQRPHIFSFCTTNPTYLNPTSRWRNACYELPE